MTHLITAKLKYLHIAPRKARFIADLIRGLKVDVAEAQLMSSLRRPSAPILKLLQSAVANAKHNYQLNKEKLYIQSIFVDNGPMFKKWTPRARGSASQIQKKTSHITLVLSVDDKRETKIKFNIKEKEKKAEKARKKTGGKENKSFRQSADGEEKSEKISKSEQPKFFQRVFRRKSV